MTGHPVHVADVPAKSFQDAASSKALQRLLQLPQNGSKATAVQESVNSNVSSEVGSLVDLVEKYSILDYPFKAYFSTERAGREQMIYV